MHEKKEKLIFFVDQEHRFSSNAAGVKESEGGADEKLWADYERVLLSESRKTAQLQELCAANAELENEVNQFRDASESYRQEAKRSVELMKQVNNKVGCLFFHIFFFNFFLKLAIATHD